MRISLICRSGGFLFALGLVAACGSESTGPAAATSEPETASVEEGKPIAMDLPIEAPAPVKVTSADPIRGKGGLEERCLAKVAEITRAPVRGTNRIEESEAAIEIYVNVDGAQAPWKCVGYKDGSLGDVMYSGSEGEL